MKLVFVYWGYEKAGSMLDLRAYARAARSLGHELIVYGPPLDQLGLANPHDLRGAYRPPEDRVALNYSQDLTGADAVIFIFEWTTRLQFGDRLDWARLVGQVPRRRRVVIDCDGAYNDPVWHEGDYNHRGGDSAQEWVRFCDSLSDKICQATLHPLRRNVLPFLFHVYDPAWEQPLDFRDKEFSMVYVGHTKWRWRPMCRVLRALERVRDRVGRVALVGDGWGSTPDWAAEWGLTENYFTDPLYLQKLGVEVLPPVPYREVIATMSRGVFNPVVYRPLFARLGLVTCRTFETPAAATIPLFALDAGYVREIYGEPASELVLAEEGTHEKILDVLARPEHYAEIVGGIRRQFARRHSPEARLRDLLAIVES